jgi:Fe-S-cluster containining protein
MKDCNSCGKCCTKYGGGDLSATDDEIELWELFNPEIAEYVRHGEIWFDPSTGKKLTSCPFLELLPNSTPKKYICSIYLNRPEDCRHYPSLISEMVRDECEMIETIDLSRPIRAQKELDELMKDSRPAAARQ